MRRLRTAAPADRANRVARTGIAAIVVLAVLLLPLAAATSIPEAGATPGVGAEYLNVSATASYSFVPSQLSVVPGESVHLRVTQEATFDHTFTLSSVAGYVFPSTATPADVYAFFAVHPPLVNLSLGAVAGVSFFANFTAPAAGSYEFLCEIPGHFQSGMYGTLTSVAPGAASSPAGLSTTTLLLVGAAVAAVVVVVAVVLVVRRRRPSPPPGPA